MTSDPTGNAAVRALLDNQRRFLDFLERRVDGRADAEDLLQGAFLQALEKGGELRAGESAVAWVYRVLRNALIDRYRGDAARQRLLESRAVEQEGELVEDPELRAEVCRCAVDLLGNLRPEHAELIRRVDLEGGAVLDAAAAVGITPNHAGVRLHRARKALLREVERTCRACASHGCLDCSCRRTERNSQ